MYQWSWYLWQCAIFAPFIGGNHRFYGYRFFDGIYQSSFVVIDLIETLGAYIMQKEIVLLISAICGLLFGTGLIVSDMANPKTVQSFLDLAGEWNPALMFVMVGALIVATIGFNLSRLKKTSLSGAPFPPIRRGIDKRLAIGSMIFGVGWGIAGICPAPAVVLMGMGIWQGVVFFVAMLVGMGMVIAFDKTQSA